MQPKVILILTIFLSTCFQLYGQERINREKLSFKKNSEMMTKAIGYSYNSTIGEWIDYENIISNNKDYKNEYNSLQSNWIRKKYKAVRYIDKMSQNSQNFINIQTKKLDFKNKVYYVIIITKWIGQFEYPLIQEDYYTYKQTEGYIYTKEEFQKLDSLDQKIELRTKSMVSVGSKHEIYDETKFLDLIQTELNREISKYEPEYIFPVLKSNEGAIRFYLPEYFFGYSKYNFDNAYFETDQENFSKIYIK